MVTLLRFFVIGKSIAVRQIKMNTHIHIPRVGEIVYLDENSDEAGEVVNIVYSYTDDDKECMIDLFLDTKSYRMKQLFDSLCFDDCGEDCE